MDKTELQNFQSQLLKENPQGFDLFAFTQQPTVRNVPKQSDSNIASSLGINRCNYQPTSATGRAIQQERNELLKHLETYAKLTNKKISPSNWLCYIPNAKLPYVNRLLKTLMSKAEETDRTMSNCDYNYLTKMWMPNDAMNSMINDLAIVFPIDTNKKDFTIANPNSKAGFAFSCTNGEFGVVARNPGFVSCDDKSNNSNYNTNANRNNANNYYNKAISEIDRQIRKSDDKNACCDDCQEGGVCQSKFDKATWIKALKNFKKELQIELAEEAENDILDDRQLSLNKPMIRSFQSLRKQLSQDYVDIPKVNKLIEDIFEFRDQTEKTWLYSLFQPEKSLGSRIPNLAPIPTAAFQVTANTTLSTNALGNVAWGFQPVYLDNAALSTFGINNNVGLTGNASSNFFLSTAIGQNVPIAIYSQYRLVSAKIKATYIGPELTGSGYFTMATNFDSTNTTATAIAAAIPLYAAYGAFQLTENSYYKDSKPCVPGSFIEQYWMPYDNRMIEFRAMGTENPGSFFVGYASGLPASTSVLRVDVYLNYEAFVSANNSDYIPTSTYKGGINELTQTFNAMSKLSRIEDIRELAQENMAIARQQFEAIKIALPKSEEEKQNERESFWNTTKKVVGGLASALGPLVSTLSAGLIPAKEISSLVSESIFPEVPKKKEDKQDQLASLLKSLMAA